MSFVLESKDTDFLSKYVLPLNYSLVDKGFFINVLNHAREVYPKAKKTPAEQLMKNLEEFCFRPISGNRISQRIADRALQYMVTTFSNSADKRLVLDQAFYCQRIVKYLDSFNLKNLREFSTKNKFPYSRLLPSVARLIPNSSLCQILRFSFVDDYSCCSVEESKSTPKKRPPIIHLEKKPKLIGNAYMEEELQSYIQKQIKQEFNLLHHNKPSIVEWELGEKIYIGFIVPTVGENQHFLNNYLSITLLIN